jgi:hypothetical protein
MRRFIWLVVCAAALSSPTLAKAVTIDFEDQSGPSSGGSPQSLTYTFGSLSVLIRGGTIHTNEATGQDKTSVFATAVTNLMAITFSAPVENFSVEVVNALAGTYGSANTEGIPLALFTIPETDGAAYTITWPSVETLFYMDMPHDGPFRWAIDNISFDVTTAVPEPSTWMMLLLGFAGLGFASRRLRKPHRIIVV